VTRHGAVDDGALGDRDAARDDVGANHRRGANSSLFSTTSLPEILPAITAACA